jgi:hypothetical protein
MAAKGFHSMQNLKCPVCKLLPTEVEALAENALNGDAEAQLGEQRVVHLAVMRPKLSLHELAALPAAAAADEPEADGLSEFSPMEMLGRRLSRWRRRNR